MKKKIGVILGVVIVSVGLIWFLGAERVEPTNIAKASKLLGKPDTSDSLPLSKPEALAQSRKIIDALKTWRSTNPSASSAHKPSLGLKRGFGHQVPNPKQQQSIDEVLAILPDSTVLHMDNFQGTLRYLRGDLSELTQNSKQYQQAKASGNFENMAFALLNELAGVTGIQSSEDYFNITKVYQDKVGLTHISLAQDIEGIPVWGADIKIHLNADSDPIEVSGIYSPAPKQAFWPEQPISEMDAVANALAELEGKSVPADTTVEKIAYWNPNTKPHPCYQVAVSPSMDESYFVFVSAIDGAVVRVYDRIISAAATGSAQDLQGNVRQVNSYYESGSYYALDTTLAMYDASSSQPPQWNSTFGGLFVLNWAEGEGDYIRSSSSSLWEPAVVSAQHNMRLSYEYFLNTHGRDSFDGNGYTISSFVHGSNPDNAFWNGGDHIFVFGDGLLQFYNLAGALDVTAHEFTHAVIQYTANLVYETQSGALNEHLADLFGVMVDRDDWLLGEDIVRTGLALRDMENPSNPNVQSSQPSTMYEYLNLPLDQDHGGVHGNSGIPNHMAYILSDVAPAIGKDKLEALAYHALNNYMVQYSQFIDYRRAMVSAAQDLYGWGSFEEGAVESAFNSVAIYDDSSTPDPVTYTGSGNEEVVFLFADESTYDSNTDFPYLLGVHIAGQNYLVSDTYAKKTRSTISGDAMELVFLAENGDLKGVDVNGEQLLIANSGLQSFSASKEGDYFSFIYPNTPSITLYDSVADAFNIIDLVIANPDGDNTILGNPDISTFSPSGDRLAFDATSTLTFSDGNEYDVWGVYSVRIADKRVTPVWQPSQGAIFGNPHFSNLNPEMIVADMLDLNTFEDQAVSINIWNQKGYVLTNPNDVIATPAFSGLDNDLIYVEKGILYNNLYSAAFLNSSFDSVSSSKVQLYEQWDPIAYPMGYADNPAYIAPKAQISTTGSLVFPDTEEGDVSEIEISVVNAGSAMLEMYDMHLVGSNSGEFSFIAPVSLVSPGSSVNVKVRFRPTSAGAKIASLKIFSTAPSQKETTISLSGTAISLDFDSDGLLDSWEMENFGNLDSVANGDYDSDGLSNLEEFIANTHPTNAQSSLRIDSLEFVDGNVRLVWHGGMTVTQRVLTASELGSTWRAVFTNYPPTPYTNELNTVIEESNAFFKIEVGGF